MKKEDCFRLGQIRKPHGFKGDLTAFLDVDSPAEYIELDIVFVETSGALVPWMIEKIELKNNGLIKLKLEGINDEAAAKSMGGAALWLPASLLDEKADDEAYLHDLIGYKVEDRTFGHLGEVAEVIEHPGNTLLRLAGSVPEKLIPFQEAFILKTDKKRKIISLSLPEGFDELW